MNARIKLLTTIFSLVILTSCDVRSDAMAQRKLAGVWVCEFTYPEGGDFKSTTTLAANGDYVCQIISHSRSNIVKTATLEGNMQIKGDVLIDIVTKHSNTNASYPSTNYNKIIRRSDAELAILTEGKFDESVFRKIK